MVGTPAQPPPPPRPGGASSPGPSPATAHEVSPAGLLSDVVDFLSPGPSPQSTPQPDPQPSPEPTYTEAALYVLPEAHAPQLLKLLRQDAFDHRIEVLVVTPRSALAQVQERLRRAEERGESPDAICLIGDDAQIPHVRFDDDTGNDDHLLTDNPYGQTTELSEEERYSGGIVDMLPVSRIPTTQPQLVARLLSVSDQLDPSWESGVAVTAESWTRASRSVLDAIQGHHQVELHDVPPLSADQVGRLFRAQPGRIYFNVHGSDRTPDWFGDDGCGSSPRALTAGSVRVREHAIAMSESCYGALIQSPDEAMSMAFLKRGADAFVGSTIIAWGPARPPCSLADLVVQETYQALDDGLGLAAALLRARVVIADGYLSRSEALPPNALNTVASFVAYGAPMARVRGTTQSAKSFLPPSAAPMGTAEQKSSGGGVLDAIRQGMRQGNTGQLGAARQRYRNRLPPGAWKAFSRGRMTFGQLRQLVDEPDLLQARLAHLAGGPVADAHVFQYASSKRFRAFVSVKNGDRCAGVLLDDSGKEVEAWVSR